MVLQRNAVISALWGTASPGTEVQIAFSFGGVIGSATTNSGGVWVSNIAAQAARSEPFSVSFSSLEGNVTISDVLIGDVLMCSGQSNLALSVSMALNASAEIAASDAFGPLLRLLQVPEASTTSPSLDILRNSGWKRSGAAALNVSGFAGYSATCYFSGRDLLLSLESSVPIGAIESSVGGTAIRQWSPTNALARCPQPYTSPVPYGTAPYALSQHYNGMIAGLTTGPTQIRAIIWDQAESDSFPQTPVGYYGCQTIAQINSWRAAWNSPTLPWLFIHLQPYNTTGLPDLRSAQLAALGLPAVSVASAIDLGDIASPFGAVHFRDKQTISARLVSALLATAYNTPQPNFPPAAFLTQTAFFDATTGQASVDVVFDAIASSGALRLNLTAPASVCPFTPYDPTICGSFLILTNSTNVTGVPVVTITGINTLTLTATLPLNTYPVGSSYAWQIWPQATLYSGDFPVLPWQQNLVLAGPPAPRN